MNILVIGCGKVGSKLASILSRNDNDVSVIDKNEASFDSLDNDFQGFTFTGFPIDLDILRSAGAENCDILAAVSSNDNVNIMVSQLAKEIFKIPIVIARIYDPNRKDVFSHFGIHTICPTNLTVSSVISAISNVKTINNINIGAHTITLSTISPTKSMIGQKIYDIKFNDGEVPYAIQHFNNTLTLVYNKSNIKILSDDKIILSKIVD